jgi:hypothetical protein
VMRSPTHASRFLLSLASMACVCECEWGEDGRGGAAAAAAVRLPVVLAPRTRPPRGTCPGACGNRAACGPTSQRPGAEPVSFLWPWSRGLCCC